MASNAACTAFRSKSASGLSRLPAGRIDKCGLFMIGIITVVKNYFSKFWDPGFLFSNVALPLGVLTTYCLVLSAVLPEGVNKYFAFRSWGFFLALAVVAALLGLALSPRGKRLKFPAKRPEKITWSDLILLLLPMMPVVQYIIRNLEILYFEQIVLVMGAFLSFSLAFILVIPWLLCSLAGGRTLMLLGAAFSFTVFNMATLTSRYSWFEYGSLKIQWPLLAGLFAVLWLFYDLGYKQLLHVLVVVLFISNTTVQFFTANQTQVTGEVTYVAEQANRKNLSQLVADRKPLSTPSIYLLIYDAYPHNETLLSHGIDNGEQEKYLEDLGFTLYPNTYSVSSSSIPTMTRVLNASAEFDGSRTAVAGSGVVQNLLSSFGYSTYGVFRSDFFFRGIEPRYDYSYPEVEPPGLILSEAILMGEFRFDIGVHRQPIEEYRSSKRQIFALDSPDPVFLYTHSHLPGHSRNIGKCLPNEAELFADRLGRSNEEMRLDLDILVRVHPEDIIIIAGDHGPWLSKNCAATTLGGYDLSEISRQDIQDRFGTFLAIRWPSSDYAEFDDIETLQDLFPAIFGYLFNDPGILDARITPVTLEPDWISGAQVIDGIIQGGVHDGEPLFVGGQ